MGHYEAKVQRCCFFGWLVGWVVVGIAKTKNERKTNAKEKYRGKTTKRKDKGIENYCAKGGDRVTIRSPTSSTSICSVA